MKSANELIAEGTELLAREAAYLDDRKFDEWIALFATDCKYWVPTWISEEVLATDPQSQLSHIYYGSRAGLEDRIVRLRTKSSPASYPMPRTTHVLGHVLAMETPTDAGMRLRVPWTSHVFYPSTQDSHCFFGSSEVELINRDGQWLFAKKKIILQNDYVPTMLDFYSI